MTIRLFAISMILASLTAGAATVDAPSRVRLLQARGRASRSEMPLRAFVIARTEPVADGLTVLRAWGGGAYLVEAPARVLDSLAASPSIDCLSLERSVSATNNISRADTGVDLVNIGDDLGEGARSDGYTGRGVLAGIFDSGFDLANPSFADADGRCRIERVFRYTDDSDGVAEVLDTPAAIAALGTDDPAMRHGSHVLGTIAGCYRGAVAMGDGTVWAKSPFDGMAPDADIAIACGPLTDACIADGVARIVDHARTQGKPCVVNLSLADILGPHDGSDAFAQVLSAMSRDAAVVVSSGNYTGTGVSLSRTFTESEPALRTFIRPVAWKPDADGAVAVWSADSRPVRLKLVVKHTLTGEEVATYNISDDTGAEPLVLVTPDFSGETDLAVTASDALGKAYADSYVLAMAQQAPSGKHGYYIQFHIDIPKTNEGARYNLGLVVEGEPGEHADMWIESEYGILHGLFVQEWSNGADDCPLSSMACAPGVVCVGASASRLEWPKLDGTTEKIWQYDTYTLGDVAPFSSFGVLSDGRTLPHVVAPGAALVSVLSTPFVEANGDAAACAIGHSDGRTDYWFADFGTSMSAPTVAGALALWLEADPSLSSDDILEVIAATSRRDAVTDAAPEKWGAGRFDAHAGIREVLRRRSALAGPSAVEPRMQVTVAASGITVALPGADGIDVRLTTLSGVVVAQASSASDTVTLPRPAPGIYLVTSGPYTAKLQIR